MSNKHLEVKPIYTKLLRDGTPNTKPLEQSDYDSLVNFIKHSFPKTLKVQKEIESTMKRTFILGRTDTKSKAKVKKKLNNSSVKGRGQRKKKKEKPIRPIRVLPRKMNYKDFLGLNSMWKEYITNLLKRDTSPLEIQSKLNKVDLHGAFLKVIESKCDSYKNLEGIVVKETKNTFVIVTTSDESKTIPKQESVFELGLQNPDGVMQIAGNSFLTRPAERVSKKGAKSFMDFVGIKTYRAALLSRKQKGV